MITHNLSKTSLKNQTVVALLLNPRHRTPPAPRSLPFHTVRSRLLQSVRWSLQARGKLPQQSVSNNLKQQVHKFCADERRLVLVRLTLVLPPLQDLQRSNARRQCQRETVECSSMHMQRNRPFSMKNHHFQGKFHIVSAFAIENAKNSRHLHCNSLPIAPNTPISSATPAPAMDLSTSWSEAGVASGKIPLSAVPNRPMISLRPPTAPIGMPPPITLPYVTRSGFTSSSIIQSGLSETSSSIICQCLKQAVGGLTVDMSASPCHAEASHGLIERQQHITLLAHPS